MDKSHTNSWNPVRALAAVLLLALFGSGYAISTQMEGTADASNVSAQPVAAYQAPTEYFPAQYGNQAQAKQSEEHIQAF